MRSLLTFRQQSPVTTTPAAMPSRIRRYRTRRQSAVEVELPRLLPTVAHRRPASNRAMPDPLKRRPTPLGGRGGAENLSGACR
ncbi:Os12g0471701 [Oryza sativa Japonica Group]|uniref:Os12g0471701 protein n=2 Tax=Oryza TaxID=4527 RepID=A0A0P0Y9W5_ORYSJ|nr:Os12g0471701 [Oryza sativa Japonica Group]